MALFPDEKCLFCLIKKYLRDVQNTPGYHSEPVKPSRCDGTLLEHSIDQLMRLKKYSKAEKGSNIFVERRVAEMLVHEVSSGQKLLEVLVADVDGDGHADGGPDQKTTASRLETKRCFGAIGSLFTLVMPILKSPL